MTELADSVQWDVFLCHNSENKRRVGRLCDELVARGLRVWFDKTAIVGSASIPLKVEEGLEGSRTIALCLSPAFLKSEWTSFERATMAYQDPANLRDTILLIEFEPCRLPRGLAHFRRIKFHRFSSAAVDEIVAALPSKPGFAPKPPSPVVSLLNDARDKQREGNYIAAVDDTRQALELAEVAGDATEDAARELARARSSHSHALLLCDRDDDVAWELANLGANAEVLDGYPDLLLSALIQKAEAAMGTGRMQIARGALLAAEKLAEDEDDRRSLLQVRANLALRSRASAEAAALFEEAEQSFLALFNGASDAETKQSARVGICRCLTNRGHALRADRDTVGARVAFSRAADWAANAQCPIDECVARHFLAQCLFDEQDWTVGLAELSVSQQLATQEGLTVWILECLELRARVLATTDHPDLARIELLRALDLTADDVERARRFHQMVATLAQELGRKGEAREHLDQAAILAEQAGDELAIADVANQLDGLERESAHRGPAPDSVIATLRARLEETEHPGEAAHAMHQLAGAHRSRGDLDEARRWFERARKAASGINNRELAASALIGLADIEMANDNDAAADALLSEALELIDHLRAWDVRASALYYRGRLQARSGDFRTSLHTLDAAHTLATEHHIDELGAQIADTSAEISAWQEIRAVPTHDLSGLADQLVRLEEWYPEARQRLRRLWWYWQGDEVMRNLMSDGRSAALITVDDATDVRAISNDLAVLFDVDTFLSVSAFANTAAPQTFVPFPDDLDFPYMNFVGVVQGDPGR